MDDKKLWLEEAPAALPAAWADAHERLVDLAVPLVDEEGMIADRDRILLFVLEDAIKRCSLEAERRQPGIMRDRLQRQLADEVARIDQHPDE